MVTTVELIRYYPSPQPKNTGKVNIPPNLRSKNGAAAAYLQSIGSLELLSPETSYNYKFEQHRGKEHFHIKHKKLDHERRKTAKDTITALKEQIIVMEEVERQRQEAEKQRQEAEKQRQSTIIIWETCNRIAEGINDFLRRVLLKNDVQDQDLRDAAKCIWGDSEKTQKTQKTSSPYHYLPLLFTSWWLYWNKVNSKKFRLPFAFNTLTLREIQRHDRRRLPDNFERGASILWYSKYHPLIEVMLTAFHAKPKNSNSIQHPAPSMDFAREFLHSSESFSDLSDKGKRLFSAFIDLGINTKIPPPNYAYLFARPQPARPAPGSGEISAFLDLKVKQLDERLETILRESTEEQGTGFNPD